MLHRGENEFNLLSSLFSLSAELFLSVWQMWLDVLLPSGLAPNFNGLCVSEWEKIKEKISLKLSKDFINIEKL